MNKIIKSATEIVFERRHKNKMVTKPEILNWIDTVRTFANLTEVAISLNEFRECADWSGCIKTKNDEEQANYCISNDIAPMAYHGVHLRVAI